MNVNATLARNYAIVVRPTVVERIWELLNAVGSVKATARCADDVQREFETYASLAAFDNSTAKQIRSLELRAHSKDWIQSAHVQFGERSETAAARLEGPEQFVSALKHDLQDQLDALQAWYSPVSRVDVVLTMLVVFGFAFLVVRTAVPDSPSLGAGIPLGRAVFIASAAVGVLEVLAAIVWCLRRIQEYCFPMATFVFGQGLERYDLQEKLRWVVIVGFIVSLFATLVGALLLA